MNSVAVISAITGLIGTIGGLLISYLTLKHIYRKDRHLIKVDLQKGSLAYPQLHTTKPRWSEEMLTFKVANTGAKDYQVVSLGLVLGKRSGGIYINDPNGTVKLPYTLKPDGTCNFWTEYKGTIAKIKKPKFRNQIKIKAYISDYIGNTFYSNKMTIVMRESQFYKLKKSFSKQRTELLKLIFP